MKKLEVPPKRKGEPAFVFEDTATLVVIGANGSGKTRFGEWIERRAGEKAHRISAQRALTIPEDVQPRTLGQAQLQLHYGNYQTAWTSETYLANRVGGRWGSNPAGHLLNDFDSLLAMLFADERQRDHTFTKPSAGARPADPPLCNIDKLVEIWSSLLPHRALTFSDGKVTATASAPYKAAAMSDGERVALYLIGQALCAPKDCILIIDEPEVHLHRAIQAPLWDRIEQARPDCTFVHITHDVDFAATRMGKRIWLKEFDGTHWTWDEVPVSDELPPALVMQLLGNRRPLLFVEGDKSSHDTKIYSALYPKEQVVPRASCGKVTEATKAFAALENLHTKVVRGIVDRDRRGTDEIASLKKAGVMVADVAEIENLLCLPEALQAAAEQLFQKGAEAKAMAAVMSELSSQVDHQALLRTLSSIQFQLNGFGPTLGGKSAAQLAADLNSHVAGINALAVFNNEKALFAKIVATSNYRDALRYFNNKGVVSFVASAFAIAKSTYVEIILGVLRKEPDGKVAAAMRAAIEHGA